MSVKENYDHSHKDILLIQRLDYLLNTLIRKLVLYSASVDSVENLVDYITSTPQTDSEVQLFLHPATFLLAACHQVSLSFFMQERESVIKTG